MKLKNSKNIWKIKILGMNNIAACKHRIKVKFMDEIRIASKKICTHHTDNHEIDILFKNIQNLLNGDYVYIVSYSII